MEDLSHFDLLDPIRETVRSALPTDTPMLGLPVFDGYACLVCSFAIRQLSSMGKHHQQPYPSGRKSGRPSACATSSESSRGNIMLEHVLAELSIAEKQLVWNTDIVSDNQSRKEISPWLEMTW
jgi:hypothetical protein